MSVDERPGLEACRCHRPSATRWNDEMAVVVASSCRCCASGSFPDVLEVGLRADRVGTTSVTRGLGSFRQADAGLLATGTSTHLFVGHRDRRRIPVPHAVRTRITTDLEP